MLSIYCSKDHVRHAVSKYISFTRFKCPQVSCLNNESFVFSIFVHCRVVSIGNWPLTKVDQINKTLWYGSWEPTIISQNNVEDEEIELFNFFASFGLASLKSNLPASWMRDTCAKTMIGSFSDTIESGRKSWQNNDAKAQGKKTKKV